MPGSIAFFGLAFFTGRSRGRLLFFFLLLFSCAGLPSACGPSTGSGGATAQQASGIDEDELIARLSMELIPSPATQAEVERNAIVNYAIDQLLDVRPTASGLFVQIVDAGQAGRQLQWGQKAKAHYTGQLLDGRVFDSSHRRGQPIAFVVGNMVQGWNEGVQMLAPGGKAILLVPSALAYGETGITGPGGQTVIPPNTPLRFDVEVLE